MSSTTHQPSGAYTSSSKDPDDLEMDSVSSTTSSDYQCSVMTTSSLSSSPVTSQLTSDQSRRNSHTTNQLVIVNGHLTHTSSHHFNTSCSKKKFICHWLGCNKSYSKPIRLQEHIRSHTNERPFSCSECPATYRRETHLTAHKRMHLPESSRPLLCGWQDANPSPGEEDKHTCQRRFWTQQHLKVHRENVHEGKKGQAKLKCQVCSKEFVKHTSLRSHFIQTHCPKDTPKPYICPAPNCSLSFSHPSRLRKHEKTHDPFRYTCVHQDCLNNSEISIHQRSFSSWTDLQRHTRDIHPFNCPESKCNRHKKPFKTLRSLKQHMQSYHTTEDVDGEGNEKVLSTSQLLGTCSRNTGSFVCTEYPPCQRVYKSARALQRHVNLNHLTDRHTSCPFEGCTFSSAFPSGLTRHIKSKHSNQTTQTNHQVNDTMTSNTLSEQSGHNKRRKLTRVEKLTQLDVLTGIGYNSNEPKIGHQDETSTSNTIIRKFACPFYDLQPNLFINTASSLSKDTIKYNHNHDHDHDTCLLRFNRLYDIQRHLLSFHSLNVDRQILKNFYGIV